MGFFNIFRRLRKPTKPNYDAIFEAKFVKVHREIDTIRSKLHLTDGAIFERHLYSVEELQRLPSFDRIRTICRAIRADVDGWISEKNFCPDAQNAYSRVEKRVNSDVAALEQAIRARSPTWVEWFTGFFHGFAKVVREILPPLNFLLSLFGVPPLGLPVPTDVPLLPPPS
ncbi:MAG: hypothetical protein JNG86_15220 [Verrucomicrobiaceae bacterium]|nr:hypothetical protein [Verrucomicrobiaceae bacterium]